MARIVIILNENEDFGTKGFAIQLLVDQWSKMNHEVIVTTGPTTFPDGDLALLHVDLSLLPSAYLRVAEHYPVVANLRAVDIRKRIVSRNIVDRNDEWEGPVIVKTDENCGGIPEWVAWKRLVDRGLPAGEEKKPLIKYLLFLSKTDVPPSLWDEPRLIVERFLPERDEEGFYLRTWIFLGDKERCRRFRSKKAIIKGNDYQGFQDVAVPEKLRAERERLGFDYGKFDFVVHRGEPVLLDVNKTPGMPPLQRPLLRDAYSQLAGGIESLLSAR